MRFTSLLMLFSCSTAAGPGGTPATLTVSSPDFVAGGAVPRVHTCQGADKPPTLSWTGAPSGTESFVVIVDDPDAPDPASPRMTWVHWVVYNLPGTSAGTSAPLPGGAREGLNDWHSQGFRGPCPPVGRHRYVHKVYALDAVLPDLKRADKAVVEHAMAGHVLGYGELVGTYQKE